MGDYTSNLSSTPSGGLRKRRSGPSNPTGPGQRLQRQSQRWGGGSSGTVEVDVLIKPCHIPGDSMLSPFSGFQDYHGLFNLAIVVLIVTQFQAVWQNLQQYGVLLLRPFAWWGSWVKDPYSWPCLTLTLSLSVYITAVFCIEKLASLPYASLLTLNAADAPPRQRKTVAGDFLTPSSAAGRQWRNRFVFLFHLIVLGAELIIPVLVIRFYHPFPLQSTLALGASTVLWMKLFSYVSVNRWCRLKWDKWADRHIEASSDINSIDTKNVEFTPTAAMLQRAASALAFSSQHEKVSYTPIQYPDNVTFGSLIYFLAAPTLCYELSYPRTQTIRIGFVIRNLLATVFCSVASYVLGTQMLLPILRSSSQPFEEMNYSQLMDRIISIAPPFHLLWMVGFYSIFHCLLNLIAEVLRFADRTFYRDWWNATTIQYFWQNWNIPVHRWAIRHVYLPMIKSGHRKVTAWIVVFFVSAFFHEYLVSVPLNIFRIWAFLMMMSQIPMAVFTATLTKGNPFLGNCTVWLVLIFNMPACVILYISDYVVTHDRDFLP
eukprot:Nk52_evm20s157 gene=Nk52_evmTU20s157